MTQQQFANKMKRHYKDLTGKTITSDEVPWPGLAKNVFGVKNEDLFFNGMISTLVLNGHGEEARKKKLTKEKASTMTIADLAQHFLTLLALMFFFIPSQSQDLQVNLGVDRTELKNGVARIALSYAKSQFDILQNQNVFVAGKASFTSFYPEVDFQIGTGPGSLNKYNVRVTGLTMAGLRVIEDEDGKSFDLSRPIHTFPFSVGLESSNAISNVNAMLYAGWVLFYQNGDRIDKFIGATKIGVFLEVGRKFGNSDTAFSLPGGAKDESAETPNSWIARAKGSFGIDSKDHIKFKGLPIGLSGEAHGWYDMANGRTYHSLKASLKFYITDTDYVSFDFIDGIGAPTFNDARQIGGSVMLTFSK